MDPKSLTDEIVKILDDKKAEKIDVIEVTEVTIMADYFIICSGNATTHIKALADEVEYVLSEKFGVKPNHIEGYETARWILLDYGDVIVHVFHEEDREYYSLERLWSDGVIVRKDS